MRPVARGLTAPANRRRWSDRGRSMSQPRLTTGGRVAASSSEMLRPSSKISDGDLWAIVLAGGEGIRLRPLLREVLHDDRPKQYVKLLGDRTLLRQTLDRVAVRIPVDRTMVVTMQQHAGYIAEEFSAVGLEPHLLAQPRDRG